MIALRKVAAYLPSTVIDNVSRGESFGEDATFIRTKIGATKLTRLAQGDDTSDLATAAVERLFATSELQRESVDALVVVTQNPDSEGLPHTSAIVQRKLGLPTTVAAFDVSLGCSGFVYGLSILRGFMEAAGLRNGVLVTADPYSKIVDPKDRVTSLLFGDAATASWLSSEGEWNIGLPLFGTDGAGADHLARRGGHLYMNGRQVFNFAAMTVPRQITALLAREQLTPEQIDLYCLHQGSATIVETIARRFPTVADRFVLDIDQCGNTVSSTIPLLLAQRVLNPAVNRILISGFGVGLSWASSIIARRA